MLWVRRRLREEILDLAQKGVDTFLTGGALGFDTLAAQEVLRMRAMGLPFRWLNFSLLVAAFALAVGFHAWLFARSSKRATGFTAAACAYLMVVGVMASLAFRVGV